MSVFFVSHVTTSETETKLFQAPKLIPDYFRSLLTLMNIFQHVQRRWNNFSGSNNSEIILFRRGYMWNKTPK